MEMVKNQGVHAYIGAIDVSADASGTWTWNDGTMIEYLPHLEGNFGTHIVITHDTLAWTRWQQGQGRHGVLCREGVDFAFNQIPVVGVAANTVEVLLSQHVHVNSIVVTLAADAVADVEVTVSLYQIMHGCMLGRYFGGGQAGMDRH